MSSARLHRFQDVMATTGSVDVAELRVLCADGIPDKPYQLRPLLWSLLLGILPTDKAQWTDAQANARIQYYHLVERKLAQVNLDEPVAEPLEAQDRRLVQLRANVDQVVKHYPMLGRPDKRPETSGEPRSGASTPLPHLDAIPMRLDEIASAATPQITISDPSSQSIASAALGPHYISTHADALCRMLYASPITYAAGQADVIAVLYLVYLKGSNSHDAEADAFWAFQKLVPDVAAAQREPSLLSDRIKWADEHLYHVLVANDLDPGLPLYAFRWQQSLLTADVFLPDVLYLLDFILAARDRGDALVNICAALLLASKKHLFRSEPVRGLWGAEGEEELDFVKGLTFLRNIPIERIGGTDAILGAAEALSGSRDSYATSTPPPPPPLPLALSPSSSITERLSRLVSSVTPPRPASMPRPLLLQGKARRASTPLSTPLRRASTSSNRSSVLWSPPMQPIRPDPETPVGRQLTYGQLAIALVGIGRRPMRVWPAVMTAARRFRSNYPDHVPLNSAQTALLAVGSGVMGILDTRRGDLIATLSESSSSTFLPALHTAMSAHPEGRQILRDRPLVSSTTVDLDRLSQLKRGTLGREYVEWLKRGNLAPDTRERVRYVDNPTLAYTMLRYRQTHDLYHTLFSLPPTLVHELTLKVVELSNMSLPVAALSSGLGPFRLTNARRQVWLEDWTPWALRVGRESKSLVGVYWEKRWEQGVGELRRELGVYRNDALGVESRWRGYRELRQMERDVRRAGLWVDEPETW